MRTIRAIVAMNSTRTIGHENKLPWHCPQDLARFKNLTQGQTIIMGRNTWDSLPLQPLPNRKNIVVTSRELSKQHPDLHVAPSLLWAIDVIAPLEDVWIIGGARLFAEAITFIDEVELTILHNNHLEGDCKLPEFESEFSVVNQEVLADGVVAYRYKRNDQ